MIVGIVFALCCISTRCRSRGNAGAGEGAGAGQQCRCSNAGAATCGSVGDALGACGSYASAAGDKLSIIVGQRRKMVGSKEKLLAPEKLSSKK